MGATERYRPVHTKLWADGKFNALSDDGKLVWMLLLTSPSMSPIPGVIVASEATLADMLGWSLERYRNGYLECLAKGFRVVSEGRLVWLQNAIRHQPPMNVNVAKFWATGWSEIPECQLKHDIWKALRDALLDSWETLSGWFPEPLVDGYAKPLGKPSGYQKKEQEQEQKKEKKRVRRPSDVAPSGHQEVVKAFTDYYRAANGGESPTWDASTGGMVKTLLEKHGQDTVLRRIGFLVTAPPSFPPQPWDLKTFVGNFDKCTGARAQQSFPSGRVEPKGSEAFVDGEVTL